MYMHVQTIIQKRIHSGICRLEDVEGRDDEQDQIEGVVVENGEGCGLVVCYLILLPQNPVWV